MSDTPLSDQLMGVPMTRYDSDQVIKRLERDNGQLRNALQLVLETSLDEVGIDELKRRIAIAETALHGCPNEKKTPKELPPIESFCGFMADVPDAPTDAARLDWLEDRLDSSFETIAHYEHVSQLESWDVENYDPNKPYAVGDIDKHWGSSLREAIDAAMRPLNNGDVERRGQKTL